ncbi:MAG: TIGR02757 family protein [Arcobacteraceae bacterium]|jgi:uncharacterized protein (TIGR02757 family)|nr:TIGR02757 family protein [Arcobacteraceae bacterium]
MLKKKTILQQKLDFEVEKRNCFDELCHERPDPIMIAKKYNDEYIGLICALFAYGNVKLIVKFLDSLNFDLLNCDETTIKKELEGKYYRFQTNDDIVAIFIALGKLKKETTLEKLFLLGYKKNSDVLEGIDTIITKVKELHPYSSKGYDFFFGTPFKRDKNNTIKHQGNSPYKRYNMFLRWMVRDDNIDLGLWKENVSSKDLILPLDTHTFKISQNLGLLKRTIYDLESAILITRELQRFDKNDPIKYDFALYRIGQEKLVL